MTELSTKEWQQKIIWYINGTLPIGERDALELALRESSELRDELAWQQSIRTSIRHDERLNCAPDLGLDKVMQRIQQNTRVAPATTRANIASPTLTLSEKIASFFSSIFASPALMVACCLVVVQFGVILKIMPNNEAVSAVPNYAETREVPTEQSSANSGVAPVVVTTPESFLRVSFNENVTEKTLRELLRAAHAEIVAGPSQIGGYFLWVPSAELQTALATLKSSKTIESIEVVNELPPRQ